MRVLSIYLLAYFVLVVGAVVALWSGGALQEVPVAWLLLGLAVAVGFGVLLAVAAGGWHTTRE